MSRGNHSQWSKDDKALLRAASAALPTRRVAVMLNRSVEAVQRKAAQLEIQISNTTPSADIWALREVLAFIEKGGQA